jgi:hypothetical protein
MKPLMKLPMAWLPIAMSIAALATVLLSVAIFGVVQESDEGAGAHIFQLLIALQVPVVAFFALKWLPKAPRQALGVLALQICAVIVAMAPVYWWKL